MNITFKGHHCTSHTCNICYLFIYFLTNNIPSYLNEAVPIRGICLALHIKFASNFYQSFGKFILWFPQQKSNKREMR